MANEAILVVETELPINMTCADGTGIEKGTICKLTSPLTASASSSANDIVAGITQSEKIANDGNTSIATYRGGVFRVYCSGSISAGDPVTTGATANYVVKASTNDENVLGIMLEDGTEGQQKLMELRPTTMQLA